MNSNITLKLKDPSLNFEYLVKRSKEILTMAILIAVLQFMTYIAIVAISIIYKWDDYLIEQWTGRVVGFIVLLILIFIEYKYPGKFSQYAGPLLVLAQTGPLLWGHGDSVD